MHCDSMDVLHSTEFFYAKETDFPKLIQEVSVVIHLERTLLLLLVTGAITDGLVYPLKPLLFSATLGC